MMIRMVSVLMVATSLGGCASLQEAFGVTPASTVPQVVVPPSPPVETLDPTPPPPPPVAANTVEEFDTTSAEDRAAATAVPDRVVEERLGSTVASLGSPTVPGIWMETPLVTALTMGRVEAANGKTVNLELRPSGGAAGSGSQISLAALRLLEIPLTELPTLTVFRLNGDPA